MIDLRNNRSINLAKPVFIYRNLNKKGVWYSVKQKGLVIGYTQDLTLKNVEFIVNPSGKVRAIKTQQRNVHAYMKGIVLQHPILEAMPHYPRVSYNPFSDLGFYLKGYKNQEVKFAENVTINPHGIFLKGWIE